MSFRNEPIRVFLSSTYRDNEERRQIVENAILLAEMQPIVMERFTAAALGTVDRCLQLAKSCDLYLGIVAHRYGWIPEGYSLSITELEYDAAKAAGRPRLMFEIDPDLPINQGDMDEDRDRWSKQIQLEAFRKKYREDQSPARFNETSLSGLVVQSLHKWRNESASVLQGPRERTHTAPSDVSEISEGSGSERPAPALQDKLSQRSVGRSRTHRHDEPPTQPPPDSTKPHNERSQWVVQSRPWAALLLLAAVFGIATLSWFQFVADKPACLSSIGRGSPIRISVFPAPPGKDVAGAVIPSQLEVMMSNLSTYCRDVKFVPWPRPARWEERPPNVVAVKLTSTVRLAGVLQIEGLITGDDYSKAFSTIGDPSEDVGDTAYRAAKDVLWKLEVTGLWFWQYYGILEPLSSISKTLNFYEVMQGTGSANAKGDAVGRILLEIFATGPAQALQLPAALQDEGGSGELAEDFIKKRYKHAIESGDLNEIEAVHVGLTDQQREGFTRFYGRVKDLKTEIYDVKVQDEGGETVVEFVRDDAFLEIGSGRNIRISLRLSVVLASSAGTWRIKSYRQT